MSNQKEIHGFKDIKTFLQFMVAGNAHFTLVSKVTGDRYTYRVQVKYDDNGRPVTPMFISLMTGKDNVTSYTPFAHARNNIRNARMNGKSKLPTSNKGVRGFFWLIRNLDSSKLLEQMEIFHEGRCGKCNRLLTVPESITSGFGPECIKSVPRQKNLF